MKTKLLMTLLLLCSAIGSYGQNQTTPATQDTDATGEQIVFRFVGNNDAFYIPWQGNGEKLTDLVATVNQYKDEIESGEVTIYVAGYSSALPTRAENLRSAAVRANRVKSELIVRNGIKEVNFKTTVFATPYEGMKSVVVVTLELPQEEFTVVFRTAPESEPEPEPQPEPKPEPKPEQQTVVEERSMPVVEHRPTADNYRIALRTNLLYNAFLVPNIGAEWRATERLGIKVDGGGSNWGSATGNVQKIWFVNPEVRYYLGSKQRFYLGAGGNYAEFNIYKGMLGNIVSGSTGYQGTMWNAGVVGGYQLPLGRCFSLDFNLGLGYNSFSYDSFSLINETRIYKAKDQTKNSFGVTQAGVTLVWKIIK